MTKRTKDEISGTETTGHEWDGVTELDTPLPRWWLFIFYGTIIWAVIYWLLMPAWPTLSGHTRGLLGQSDRADVVRDVGALEASRAPLFQKLSSMPLDQVQSDPELFQFAQEAGKSAFADNCATCHGAGGQGAKGYPSLADDVWLWDGSVAGIRQSIFYGIRNGHPEARETMMPAYGRDGLLEANQIESLTQHILAISGDKAVAAQAIAGAELFAVQCSSCHGVAGKGDQVQGAPNLTDKEWLYGGTRDDIYNQIWNARGGAMPVWSERLKPGTIDALTVYVHSLGGGT